MSARRRFVIVVSLLMLVHGGLLAWSASRHSPTLDEPAHLSAGLSHWQYGHFDLYRVNPPLVRMIAALPVLWVGAKNDWHSYSGSTRVRPEFEVGKDFIAANAKQSFWLLVYARWASLGWSLLGAAFCCLWATEAFGRNAGIVATTLWCFSPETLGHGQLITPDIAAAALGLGATYLFWRWLRRPNWRRAIASGLLLGVAELSKTTLLLLVVLWPVMWLAYRCGDRNRLAFLGWRKELIMLACQGGLAIYVLNGGYAFENTCQQLGRFEFVSHSLSGIPIGPDPSAGMKPVGNRFRNSWIALAPVPVPANYVLGLDAQKSDFEASGQLSYLRGRFQSTGWWYYYLYAALVKLPLGTWALFILAILVGCLAYCGRPMPGLRSSLLEPSDETRTCMGRITWQDQLVLLLPPTAIFVLVSSQTGLNHHFRYVLPAYPFMVVWISQIARCFGKSKLISGVGLGALTCSVLSPLAVYPHTMSYFNEAVGGPLHGHDHLINSNIDWGQDLWKLERWLTDKNSHDPLYLAYCGYFDAATCGLEFSLPPRRPVGEPKPITLQPGLYAISVNFLRGYPFAVSSGDGGMTYADRDAFSYFRQLTPVHTAGYSIYVYRVESTTRLIPAFE